MTGKLMPVVGPYRHLSMDDDGTQIPYYVLRFDKAGLGSSPRSTAHALDELRDGAYTDVFVFSHGWNNDWAAATGRYDHFIDGFARTRRERKELDRAFRPLLIGVFWPSAILVFPGERAPAIAGAPPEAQARAQEAEDVHELNTIAEALPGDTVERFYELMETPALDDGEADELAKMLAPLHAGPDEEWGDQSVAPSADDLVASWRRLPRETTPEVDPDDFGTVDGTSAEPAAAGFPAWLDPRSAARGTTVRMMRDRAGVVGSRGVGPLIRDVLEASTARLHLVGHSYGCRVCLSAVAARPVPRAVNSMLLLQPAVNHLCFSDRIAITGQPGGYRPVLDRVEQPVLSTYSRHDRPLVKLFHLALTRDTDLGEPQIAAWPEPPSLYAALGGYGPGGASPHETVDIKDPGQRYELGHGGGKVLAINGSSHIGGHSDISNVHTWWALYDQVAA